MPGGQSRDSIVTFFEGPAGTGKTTRLFGQLTSVLSEEPLGADERVLALTFMHGSRRRLDQKLREVRGLGSRFVCETVDSFAARLVRRWRSLVLARNLQSSPDPGFDATCDIAAALLDDEAVRKWVVRAYPILVVDEMQDCRESRLKILTNLAQSSRLLAAADGFQDLSEPFDNSSTSWLQLHGTSVPLGTCHRTSVARLVQAAANFREGRSVPDNGRGFSLFDRLNANAAAGAIATQLHWQGRKNFAILTPSRGKFFERTVKRLCEKPLKPSALKGIEVGPFSIQVERSSDELVRELCTEIELPDETAQTVSATSLCFDPVVPGATELQQWFDYQRRAFGRTVFPSRLVRSQVERIVSRRRSFIRRGGGRLSAMTIHQAKNREFDNVALLWPYEVSGSEERLRRLAYNAVTRARDSALIVVQSPPPPKPQRSTLPPFSRSL